MGSALIALAAAVVGVTGTLVAPVLSQRLLARVQAEQFEREQRVADAQWRREQQVAELDRRRGSYVQVNASFRRYRTHLMKFLWTVHKDAVTPEARELVEEARSNHHSVFAEAQLIASATVLAELDQMTTTLSQLYQRIMRLEEGDPAPDGSFNDIRTDFVRLWDQWERMRSVMRTDLAVEDSAGDEPATSSLHVPPLPADGPETAQAA
ncbi:hypothetical protein ACTWJ8_15520 [Streptomyces sp. SDT5-1]|uniref:hypothetical protein n=1 Tax=Streptomyces sp. SDT5-1 TaxID=3406418 RepID=UPI003FD05C09